jgi:hypothetical protein
MPSFEPSFDVGAEKMPFPILGAIGLGTQLLGNIFGGLSAAKKERDALKREQSRQPFQLSKIGSQAYRTGYSPNGTGQNIYSLLPMMNPRMAAMFGSRYNSIYHPNQAGAPVQGAAPGPARGKMLPEDDPMDNIYREVAQQRQG